MGFLRREPRHLLSGAVMATRVFVNVDEDPFCAELVFPRGLEGGAFVSLVFGRFSRHQGSTGRKHLALQRGANQGGPVGQKVFISVPYGERQPLCTLREAPLPDDLQDIPDPEEDDEAVDDVILAPSNAKAPSTGDGDGVQCGTLCTSCNGWFCSVEVLQIHRALTHARSNATAKPVKTVYGCKVCRKTFPSSADCLLHKWKHRPESEWPFQCKSCQRGFLRQAAFVRHQQSHAPQCRECNLTFGDHDELHKHNVSHQHGRETFLCVHCEQLFLSKAGLQRHIARYHGSLVEEGDPESVAEVAACLDSQPVELHCPLCTFGCTESQQLAQHTASSHPEVPTVRCSKCEQAFLKEEELSEHLSLKHQLLQVEHAGDGSYVCHVCDRRLKTFSGYWGHLRSHTKMKPFLCDQCGHRYTSRGSLTKHKRTHDFANASRCPHCGKEFATLDYMRNHERLVHTRDFKFPCRLCGHRFPNERKQQTHMAVVHEQELSAEELASLTRVRHQRCPDCPFATYSALQFRQHRATHTGRYPFACTHCTRAFAFRFQLTLHVRRHHRQGGPLACPHCPRRFVAEETHKAHVALHGAPHAVSLMCTDCNCLYETPRLLDKHRAALHGKGEPRYACRSCSKRFRTAGGMAAHYRVIHGGFAVRHYTCKPGPTGKGSSATVAPMRRYGCSRWPFSCEPCGRFFKFESSLRAHRVCFHGLPGSEQQSKSCPECGKSFQTELSLSMHLRTHTQEVHFKCSVCSKLYRSRSSLKKHVALVHRACLRCFCPHCGKGFLGQASLALHTRFCHKAKAAQELPEAVEIPAAPEPIVSQEEQLWQ